jgi:hypothetical protein
VQTVRGTGEAEIQLKNAITEHSEEGEEIARYTAIETLAASVGDRETAQMARQIRREEERMAAFLARQIPPLTKQVVRETIPRAERNGGRRRAAKRATSARSPGTSSSRTSPRSTSKPRGRAGSSGRTGARGRRKRS